MVFCGAYGVAAGFLVADECACVDAVFGLEVSEFVAFPQAYGFALEGWEGFFEGLVGDCPVVAVGAGVHEVEGGCVFFFAELGYCCEECSGVFCCLLCHGFSECFGLDTDSIRLS